MTVWGFQPLFALVGHLEVVSTPNFAYLENKIKIFAFQNCVCRCNVSVVIQIVTFLSIASQLTSINRTTISICLMHKKEVKAVLLKRYIGSKLISEDGQ